MLKKFTMSFLCLLLICGAVVTTQHNTPIAAMATTQKITSIKPILMTVKQGANVVLPKTVSAKTTKGLTNVSVTWKTKKVNTNILGKTKVLGTVRGYTKNVELTITVEKFIASIDSIETTVKQNEEFTLPESVVATYSDKSTKDCNVIWNEIANTSKVGTFKFEGTVKGYDKKAQLVLNVNKYIASINNLTATIKHNDKFELPQTVAVKMSDDSEESKAVVWNQKLDASILGKTTIDGVVEGYDNKVLYEITVNNFIKSVNDLNLNVVQEDPFTFPKQVKCTMSNGTEMESPVKWNNEKLDTNQVGVFSYVGTVEGYSEKVVMSVTVKSNKLTVKEISAFKNSVVKVEVYDHHKETLGTGSGFVISADGLVVTCYHVIDKSQSCKVFLESGQAYEVESILGYNKDKDIAILKLKDATGLPVVKLGNSDKVEIGEEVVAIGNPLGLINTVSAGTVSGLNRKIDDKLGNSIQFTAGVTFGSSGGALFNMKGEIIGMTNAGMSGSGNLNFAITINEIKTYFAVSQQTTFSTLFPLTDDQKYEMELEKKYKNINILNNNITLSSVYVEKEDNEVLVSVYYDNENYDIFNNIVYKTGKYSQSRSQYQAQILNLYNEVKAHYANTDIAIIILGEKKSKEKLEESDFDKVTYDSSEGLWYGRSLFGIGGNSPYSFIFYWKDEIPQY